MEKDLPPAVTWRTFGTLLLCWKWVTADVASMNTFWGAGDGEFRENDVNTGIGVWDDEPTVEDTEVKVTGWGNILIPDILVIVTGLLEPSAAVRIPPPGLLFKGRSITGTDVAADVLEK